MTSTGIIFIVIGVYIALLGISYYLIYHKHHKRNNIKIDELIELVTKYVSITTISIFIIGCGIYMIITLAKNRFDYNTQETISNFIFGILLISVTIYNYIVYLRNSLKDLNQEVKEAKRKYNLKVGEIIELIVFTILILLPIFKIPVFIKMVPSKELYIEIAKTVAISVSAIFLLYNLNPIGIKERIFKKKDKNKDEE